LQITYSKQPTKLLYWASKVKITWPWFKFCLKPSHPARHWDPLSPFPGRCHGVFWMSKEAEV